jgi:hypothetical protein
MVAMAEILVLVLVALLCVWRFRRSAMYRNRRRWGGGVSVQFTRPTPTFHGQRTNVPPPRPELFRDDDSAPSPSRHWRIGRNERASALLADGRGHGSMKVFLRERSMRRSAAQQLASVRRLPDAQRPNMRGEFETEGVMADRVRERSVARQLRRFFSPSEYPRGRVAGRLACVYFALMVLVIVTAVPDGKGDGTFSLGLAFVATLPLSLGLLTAQDDGAWMLAALCVCALVNAFVFWVVFRGDPT